MAAPIPLSMKRDDQPAARPGFCTSLFCCTMRQAPSFLGQQQRNERVFYDSAVAHRNCLGSCHYCVACPGWSKATSERVVYSRWELLTLSELPGAFIACCNPFGTRDDDWRAPDPKAFQTSGGSAKSDEDGWCTCRFPCGRTLDTFDADIIVDASAHQTLCQVCRGEGDLVLYRRGGADLSDPSEVFVFADVVRPFDVFNEITFELSKINLRGAAAATLGARMGATVWSFDARAGADGPPIARDRGWRGERETVYYDSRTAPRTLLGACCHHDVCCPHEYKVTSERVTYTKWDLCTPAIPSP